MTGSLHGVWLPLLVLGVLFTLGVFILDRADEIGLAAAIVTDLVLLAGLAALLLVVTPHL